MLLAGKEEEDVGTVWMGAAVRVFFFQGRERRLGENGVLGLGLGLGFCLCCLPNVQNYPPFYVC